MAHLFLGYLHVLKVVALYDKVAGVGKELVCDLVRPSGRVLRGRPLRKRPAMEEKGTREKRDMRDAREESEGKREERQRK